MHTEEENPVIGLRSLFYRTGLALDQDQKLSLAGSAGTDCLDQNTFCSRVSCDGATVRDSCGEHDQRFYLIG